MTTRRTQLALAAALTACLAAAAPSRALAQSAQPDPKPAAAPAAEPSEDEPSEAPPRRVLRGPRPVQPPKGYGLIGVPPGYYAPPGSVHREPITWYDPSQDPTKNPSLVPPNRDWQDRPAPLRRNPSLAGGGGAVMGGGLLTFFIGLGMQINNTECHTVLYILPSCRQKDAGVDTAAKGTMIAGGLLFFIGLPIMITGLTKRPVEQKKGTIIGYPTPFGWGWKF
jgi:hypothetical protein